MWDVGQSLGLHEVIASLVACFVCCFIQGDFYFLLSEPRLYDAVPLCYVVTSQDFAIFCMIVEN